MIRRSFLGSILALGAAPAIVRADSLMRVIPTGTTFLTGTEVLRLQEAFFANMEWPSAKNISGKLLASMYEVAVTIGEADFARIRQEQVRRELPTNFAKWDEMS